MKRYLSEIRNNTNWATSNVEYILLTSVFQTQAVQQSDLGTFFFFLMYIPRLHLFPALEILGLKIYS